MALGYLFIFYGFLLGLGILLQLIFYLRQGPISYLANMLYALGLAYLSFTSQPSNYFLARILAIFFGLLGPLSLIIRNKYNKQARLLMSLSILAGLLQLFI